MSDIQLLRHDLEWAMQAIRTHDAVLILDLAGNIVAANQSYLRLCGYQRDEIVVLVGRDHPLLGHFRIAGGIEDHADPGVVALNRISDYATHDAQLGFDVGEEMTFFLNVDNVFDKKPQYLPGAQFGTPTGLETAADFDVIGRRFTAGARVRF